MAEQHLGAMKKFVAEYGETVIDLEENMADRVSLVWDPTNDPIGLASQPFEAKRIQDLFSSDNKPFDKVMTVCAYLCWEIQQLQAQVADKFYAPLAAFGVTMAEVSPNDVDEEVADGELELQVGRLMEKFADNKIVIRQQNLKVMKKLISSLSPAVVLPPLLTYTSHDNSHIREQAVNVVIQTLLASPSQPSELYRKAMSAMSAALDDVKPKVQSVALLGLHDSNNLAPRLMLCCCALTCPGRLRVS